jgi:glycosyltransferase involved in cell wall biosynthesis
MDAHDKTRVTVVVPVFNRLRYLGATLDSVLAQTHQGWELIVVDDGSQEDVAGFMAHYTDPRISFVRQANQGNAVARNTGIAQGQGGFVICLDSDDVWHPAMLASCVARLVALPEVNVVYTQVQYVDGDGQLLPRPIGPKPHNGDLLEPLLMGYPILPSSALARRSCFERWGAYTHGLDDWELWLRWAAQGCRFVCIEQPLLQYRIHDQNFNLAYDRRRAAHFAMLDKFFAEHENMEGQWLKSKAYGNQHRYFAVTALEQGRWKDGVGEFCHAVRSWPAYLENDDFYFQLACASQMRRNISLVPTLNIDRAEDDLVGLLDAFYAQPDLADSVQLPRSTAYAFAYLALARVAYAYGQNMVRARRCLRRSAMLSPRITWQSQWLAWYGRTFVGRHAVKKGQSTAQDSLKKLGHSRTSSNDQAY